MKEVLMAIGAALLLMVGIYGATHVAAETGVFKGEVIETRSEPIDQREEIQNGSVTIIVVSHP